MFAKKSNFLYNIDMPKVYYGKDSITPSFLQSNHDSDSEVFRSQVAKDSLRQSEESSLESSYNQNSHEADVKNLEQKPFYTGSTKTIKKTSKKSLSSRLRTAKKLKKYSPLILAVGAFLAVVIFLFVSVSTLGHQIETLITRATDTMFGSYSENTIRITEELLAKKQGTFPKYFETRLKTNGIEVADKGDSYNFLYDGATITPENFRNFYTKNVPFQEAFTKAKRARSSNFFDKPAVMNLAKIGITRNLYSAYRSTGNHETDTKNYHTTEEGVFGEKTNTSVNTTTETEHTDKNGNKTTEVNSSGEDIDSSNVSGDTPEVKANNYLLSTAGRVAEAGGLVCGALKVANLISVAVAANQIYQAMHYFISNQENISKTKAGYGNEAAINPLMNFLTTSTTAEYTDIKTGQTKTVTGAPIQAEGFNNILAGENVDLNMTKNYSVDSVFLASGVALGLTAARAKACGGIRAVGAVISLATLAFGGGLIKTAITLVKTTVINVAIAATIAGMLAVLLPYIQKALFENPAKNLAGKPAGEAYVKGAALLNKKVARSTSGQALASKEYATSYYQETVLAAAREAQLDREKRSPFDTSSPNTFLGSILGRFSRISTASNLFANLTHLTSITQNSFGSFLGQTTAKVYAADGSENFVTDTDLAGINYQKIFSDESTCESLSNIGAACDMYGAEITATDTSVEKISSSDPEYQKVVNQNIRKNTKGFDEVIPNSLLARKIMFCDERDSPFGHYDSNIANAFNISLGFANNIPIISDAVELVNAVTDMTPEAEGWSTGSFCVMGKTNPYWEQMKYLQHYIENNRICTQIKCTSVTDEEGNDQNPITAYKEAYYAKNPIDTSRPGILARISGITKNQAEIVLALLDYASYLANYHPPKSEKATLKDQLKIHESQTPATVAFDKATRYIYYSDLKTITRNRSTLA